MAESSWTKVYRDADLEEGVPRLVKSGDDEAFVVRLDGKVHAVGNKCPHYECPLNEGILFGREIVCKCHNARFDIVTGRMVSAPALKDLPVYPVRLEAGEIWLGPAEKPGYPKPLGTDPRTFLIVGAGAAGNAAAETLRREGFAGRIVMITSESDQPYDRPNLSKEFMSGEAKPEWLPLRGAKFYANQGIEVFTNTKATAVDPRGRTVTIQSGEKLSFDKALLATGAAPRKPAVPGADGEACFSLRSFADARLIAEAAGGAGRAALIGSGFIGMELASSLRVRGIAVDVVAPEALPLSNVVGERIASYLKRRHEEKGVTFHMGATAVRISGDRGAKIVEVSDGTRLSADFVVFGLGVQPVIDYLSGTDLAQNGGVPVNARLETKYPDVYAAGDIAIVPNPAGGDGLRIEHWVTAERQGQHAARSMLGSSAGYDEVPFFWTRQTGISLKYAGFAREWDAIAVRGDVDKGKFLAGYYRKGILLAAASIGMPNELTAVEMMLKKKIALPEAKFADAGVDLFILARG
jgi:NADPH-dependent 2,4-dienoyl-CoA reductase/sulfur reductase-like enzyme/nitrite reductase/ring-hydroxylating ferredoxin subunit